MTATIRRVNEKRPAPPGQLDQRTANDDHRHTDPQNLDAWASEAEETWAPAIRQWSKCRRPPP